MSSLPLLVSSLTPLHVAALASLLVTSVWQGVLLTAIVALILQWFPGLPSAARSTLWTAVLALVVAMPFFPLAAPASLSPGAGLWHVEEGLSVGVVLVWLAASVMRLGQLARDLLRLRAILRRATPVDPSRDVAGILAGLSRHVLVCSSEDVDRPGVAGFFRPRILLPPALLAGLSESELVQVVLHEAEHLRRYDDWVNLLQGISLVLFPLNPALFWLNRRLSLEREMACDDGVLRSTGARKAYAACLARVAEQSLFQRGVALALGLLGDWFGPMERRPELAQRVERILSAPTSTMSHRSMRLATGGVLAGLLGGASLLAHSPALVSFAPIAPTFAASLAPQTMEGPTFQPVRQLVGGRQSMVEAVMRLPASRSAAGMQAFKPEPGRVRAHVKTSRSMRGVRAVAYVTPRVASAQRRRVQQRIQQHIQQPMPWRLTSWSPGTAEQHPGPAVQTPEIQVAVPANLSTEQVAPAQGVVPVLLHNAGIWYTAVPVQGGWLIVQL